MFSLYIFHQWRLQRDGGLRYIQWYCVQVFDTYPWYKTLREWKVYPEGQ